ncbi:Dehydrogenases with different specificities (related to short-chain alcohol dehydrogenases) [Salinisphaera sp. LB1]|nr:Dehydrogenases with different specificities (related to short-chain alcohol dehydrogenases) [Salinisphaera sp. LB1]
MVRFDAALMTEKHILIQGGGRGLGLALVGRVLTDHTTVVTATARDPESSADLVALRDSYGDRLALQPLDITDESSIEAARVAAAQRHPRLDLMITCAGLLHDEARGIRPEKKLSELDPNHLATSFTVNAIGPALMIKHFHDLMTHGDRAVIASISARIGSISDNGTGGWYGYRASKAAQNQFTRTAAIELARRSKNLICVGLHPGTVDTGLSKPFQKRLPEGQLQRPDQAAKHLLGVIAGLTPDDTGLLFDWAGQPIAP